MFAATGAPRRAAVGGMALAIVVLLLLAVQTLQGRTLPPLERLGGESVGKPPAAAPPVIPQPVEPATPQPSSVAVPVDEPTSAPPAPPFEPVPTTTRGSVAVALPDDAAAGLAQQVLADVDGLIAVAEVEVGSVTLGGVPVEVALIDPAQFRPFTPEATANHEPLWSRIVAGDVAVTHEFAETHDVLLGSTLGLGAPEAPVRIGAFATNGTPPVADAIMHRDQRDLLGPTTRRMLVGLVPEASPEEVTDLLADAGLQAEEIPDPRVPNSQTVVPAGGITPENVWDHLAMCESSGDWHINTGNGYYGGLQFLPESWAAVGGRGLPHEHTREEQIYRASLLWQIQGWEAWPQCARKLGLIVDRPAEPGPTPSGAGDDPGTATG